MTKLTVLLVKVGEVPIVAAFNSTTDSGYYNAMSSAVGGMLEVIQLDDGVELWCNEEALMLDLPLNRVIPAKPRAAPTLFGQPVPIFYASPGLAKPGEPGEWRIHGDFFLARSNDDGETVDIDQASIDKYTQLWAAR